MFATHTGKAAALPQVQAVKGWRMASAALLVSVSTLASGQALADAAPSDNTEIVVTATKRSESLQNVPISITAMGGEQLAQHQVAGFDDYAKMLPSLSYQSFGPGQSQMNMRGISTGGDGLAIGPLPTVGLYLDETPLTTIGSSVDVHVYDMARVEALSGPQGTLYGASSLAGTLRLIPNKPVIGKWEGGLDVEGNAYGHGGAGTKLEGFVNVPINERAALRVSAYYQHDGGYISNTLGSRTYQRTHDDGTGTYVNTPLTVTNSHYVKNDFNPVDSAGGRAALKVDLDDNWTVTPGLVYQHQAASGSFLFDAQNAGDLAVHDFTPDHSRDDWYLASMTLQGKVSDWDVTYSGSYFGRKVDTVVDYSYFTVAYDQIATALPASYAGYTYLKDSLGNAIDPTQTVHMHDAYTKMSQELRLSSPSHNRWRMTAGAFWQRQTDRHIADYILPGVSTAAADPSSLDYPPAQVAGAPTNDVFYTNVNRVDRDYALFAEGSYDLLDNLTATGGIRGFKADNTLFGFSGSPTGLSRAVSQYSCTVATVYGCPNVDKHYKETGETHKLSLNWKIDQAKMVYATYSTGFRPGGANRDGITAGGKVLTNGNYAADTLTNYELGFKTSWLGRKLHLNGAVFWEDWNNVQYSQPGALGIYAASNVGNARSRGIELQVQAKPVRGLTLSGNGSYIDAKLTTAVVCVTSGGCAQNTLLAVPEGYVYAAAGTRLPITPRVKLNATARYEWSVGLHDLFVQAGLNYQGGAPQQLRTDWEQTVGSVGAFTTVDASAGVSHGAYSFSLYATNLFDERGILSKNSSCAPSLCGANLRLYPTKPQQFGIKAGYKF